MIRVTVEMLPGGNPEKARSIGVGYITNEGSGSPDLGNYSVKLMKSGEYAKRGGVWKSGSVINFPRLRLGPWDLLFVALASTVASRSKRTSTAVKETSPEEITDEALDKIVADL